MHLAFQEIWRQNSPLFTTLITPTTAISTPYTHVNHLQHAAVLIENVKFDYCSQINSPETKTISWYMSRLAEAPWSGTDPSYLTPTFIKLKLDHESYVWMAESLVQWLHTVARWAFNDWEMWLKMTDKIRIRDDAAGGGWWLTLHKPWHTARVVVVIAQSTICYSILQLQCRN